MLVCVHCQNKRLSEIAIAFCAIRHSEQIITIIANRTIAYILSLMLLLGMEKVLFTISICHMYYFLQINQECLSFNYIIVKNTALIWCGHVV